MRQTRIAVVGGGPAGLAAAIAAARAGAAVVLLDEQPEAGGQLRYRVQPVVASGEPVRPPALAATLREQAHAAGVDLRLGAVVWGLFDERVLAVAEAAADELTAARIILATGSTDTPLAFAGATLPGVFSARAAQILLHRHRVRPGRRWVVLGGAPEAAELAADIPLAGGEVVAVFDPAGDGTRVTAEGADAVQAVWLDGRRVPADIVVVAIGRQPDPALALMAGCRAGFAAALGGWVPTRDDTLHTSIPTILVAGDAAGPGDIETSLAEGTLAGLSAAGDLGLTKSDAIAAAAANLDDRAPTRRTTALAGDYVQG